MWPLDADIIRRSDEIYRLHEAGGGKNSVKHKAKADCPAFTGNLRHEEPREVVIEPVQLELLETDFELGILFGGDDEE